MRDVAKCPCCLEWVGSAGIVGHAHVQCPLCGGQYAAQELLKMEPPDLLILPSSTPNDPAMSEADSATTTPAIEPQSVDDRTATTLHLPKPSQTTAESSVRPPLVVESLAPGEGAPVPSPFVGQPKAEPPSVARTWKARRRRKRPLVELFKIVLGGLAGIVIAQLILWWLPGDLRRDPFGLAPRLPVWLQWLRPSELGVLRGAPATIRDGGVASAAIREDPFVDDAPVMSAMRLPIDDPSRGDAALSRTADRPPPSLVASVNRGIESPLHVTGLPVAPVYTGAELQEALARVRMSLEDVRATADRSDVNLRDQQRLLYQRLCDVAQLVTFVDVDDAQIGRRMKAVEALTARIAREPSLRTLVGEAAVSWLGFSSRTSDGIAVVGQVTQIRQAGKWFETEIQLQAKSSIHIYVLSARHPMQDPREPYEAGQQIVLLGSILPQTNSWLPAAGAARNRWIWRGFHAICRP